jgi:hypothetical protein
VLDAVRILTHQRHGEGVVAQGGDRAEVERGAAERARAVALQALVGGDLHERRLARELVAGSGAHAVLLRDRRVDDVGRDAGDLHPITVA